MFVRHFTFQVLPAWSNGAMSVYASRWMPVGQSSQQCTSVRASVAGLTGGAKASGNNLAEGIPAAAGLIRKMEGSYGLIACER